MIFVLVGFATSIIWTWIVNNAKGSILIANLLHSASNANTVLILKLLPVSSPAIFQEGTFLIYGAYVVCALVVIIFTRVGSPVSLCPQYARSSRIGPEKVSELTGEMVY